jgi:glycine betaine/proline transport system ATP-binding protein
MTKPVKLEVEGLYKVFGDSTKKALEMVDKGLRRDEIFAKTGSTVGVSNANFKVYKGEIFVVVGLSGSGKSTVVRLLNRLIEPTRGTVTIDGENVTKMSDK